MDGAATTWCFMGSIAEVLMEFIDLQAIAEKIRTGMIFQIECMWKRTRGPVTQRSTPRLRVRSLYFICIAMLLHKILSLFLPTLHRITGQFDPPTNSKLLGVKSIQYSSDSFETLRPETSKATNMWKDIYQSPELGFRGCVNSFPLTWTIQICE